MAGPDKNRHADRCGRSGAAEWSHRIRRAIGALEARLARVPELSPAEVAHTVAATLPQRLGRRLLAELDRRGWLRRDAVIPFDALEDPARLAAWTGPERELLRLAVFGLPGQGLSSRDKHRDIVFQQLCTEIMRSAVDTASLRAIAARVLNHPDALQDSLLSSQLNSFIAQREAALRAPRRTPQEEHAAREQRSKLHDPFARQGGNEFPTRQEITASFSRLQSQFDAAMAQFEEHLANQSLEKMRELRRRFPVHIPPADLQQCEEQYDRFLKRAGTYRRQIRELAQRAAEAAAAGDQVTAAWVTRRLQAIHALLPTLLPPDHLEELRGGIEASEHAHESEEATQELVAREREVVVEIKNLAGIIHRFHELAQRLPPTDERYQRAEVQYRAAVARIRALDTDWLAGLILQLETLQDDLDDSTGAMHTQLDQFIFNVRTALNRLRIEIRTIQARNQRPADGQMPSQSA